MISEFDPRHYYTYFKEEFSEFAGVTTRALIGGPDGAPTLLAVHGYGADARFALPMGYRLAGPYRVVAIDLRGSGKSAPPDRGRPLLVQLEEQLRAAVHHYGAERLVAHSVATHPAARVAADGDSPLSRVDLMQPLDRLYGFADALTTPAITCIEALLIAPPGAQYVMRWPEGFVRAWLNLHRRPTWADVSLFGSCSATKEAARNTRWIGARIRDELPTSTAFKQLADATIDVRVWTSIHERVAGGPCEGLERFGVAGEFGAGHSGYVEEPQLVAKALLAA